MTILLTVKDRLVEALRDEIIQGKIAPGEYLRLEDIALRYEVSTMPVREALRDLDTEGLVTIFPHRGTIVTKLSDSELQDIYDIRSTLEKMATRLAVPYLTDEILSELSSMIEEMDGYLDDVAVFVKLNNEFHHTIYAASGRDHLCELIRLLRFRTQHYLHVYITDSSSEDTPKTQVEHKAIFAACQKGDADQAAELMYRHVDQVGRAIVEYVRLNDADQISPE